jgi:CheY-like chemotaxis protein
LLKNSEKFTPTGGHVTLRSENPAPGRIRVVVTDTGRGIRPDLLPRLFEPFEQGDLTAVGRSKGLGLGLSIARDLVERHGGSLSAASDGEGRGASFTVELTTTSKRAVAAPLLAPDKEKVAARQRTSILVVEDDVDTADALHQLLAESGYSVRVANSVAAATRIFQERPADILVTDVGLPDGSGLELLGALKTFSPQLRAIVLSGYGMERDIERSRSLGFAEHFVKPLNLTRLIAALDALGPQPSLTS